VSFIERHKDRPFFLYLATHDIHVPRVPHARFAGKSTMGPRGDVILQFDWTVGEIARTLDRLKLADHTLIIVTSDNGPVVDDGYRDQAVEKLGPHTPSGPWRGGKYSAFEAGTRVPLIVRWPSRVKPGTSDALMSQIDLLASFASLTGQTLPPGAAPDSQNTLKALLGESPTGRAFVVEQAGALSLLVGNWKYIEPRDGQAIERGTNIELGNSPEPQLYDRAKDAGERTNLAAQFPDTVKELAARLAAIRAAAK
jgi:arylsulfatase A-like enzyme